MIKLLPCPYTNRLTEAFQSNEIKFAFVNNTEIENEYQILMPFVKCREYFNELLMINAHPNEFKFDDVHGFKYDVKYPINQNTVLLAIKFPRKEKAETFIKNLDYLNKIETQNNLDRVTTIEKTNITNTYLITASHFWLQKCILFNIYSMLLKLLALDYPSKSIIQIKQVYDQQQTTYPTEINYLTRITEHRFLNILDNLTPIAAFESKYIDGSNVLRTPYSVHGMSGLTSLLTYPPSYNPEMKEIMSFFDDVYPRKAA